MAIRTTSAISVACVLFLGFQACASTPDPVQNASETEVEDENSSVYGLESIPSEMLSASWNKGSRTARVRPLVFGWEQADWHAVTTEESLEKGQPRKDNQVSARFAFAWDKQALHVMVPVVDGEVVNTLDADRLHEQDCVEMYIDPQDDGLAWGSEKDFRFGFAVTDKAWEWFGGRHEEVVQTVVQTESGYEVRATIPWSVLGVTPSRGLKMQSSVAVQSVNKRGDSSVKLNWRFKQQAGRIQLGELVLE